MWTSLAISQVGLVMWVNTALIGIANSAFSHEFGCGIHPHLWQIMLLYWLMCHPLYRVSNHVAHLHDLCSIWDTDIPRCTPESLFLACIIDKTLHYRQDKIHNPPSTSKYHPPDFKWTLTTPTVFLSWKRTDCNQHFMLYHTSGVL